MSRPKVSVYIAKSLDGFIAGPDHSLDWLDAFGETGEDYGFPGFFDSIDTMVMGRNTYDVVTALPHDWPYASKRTIILSSRPGVPKNNEEFYSGSLADLLEKVDRDGGRHIYADGGAVIRSFLAENLVDELTISVMPVLLGAGIPLFGANTPGLSLKLIEAVPFKSGVVNLHYSTGRD